MLLWGNRIQNDGAAALASMLELNANLHTLQLTNNRIGDDGVGKLCDGLVGGGNHTLTALDLSINSGITDSGATILAAALETKVKSLTSLMEAITQAPAAVADPPVDDGPGILLGSGAGNDRGGCPRGATTVPSA